MSEDARRMMSLFEGFAGAYGTHGSMSKNMVKGGKQEIKKTARTVREPVTVELWEKHLSGEQALGIIPIREDQQCLWGCIDVDRYDIDLGATVREIKKRKLPLVICRTKSGGAHAFLFLSKPEPAPELRASLKQMAASMGWGDCEIFPKQNQILAERGDLGNWLNMPYLDAENTKRYGVKETMAAYDINEFLNMAENSKVSLSKISSPAHSDSDDETIGDGPPCLQHLTKVGFPDGTRNKGLFALGVFCKRKFGSRWVEMLEQYNRDFMKPPLNSDEVAGLIRNLETKDYNYTCKDEPLQSYCNSTLCRARKFGVGGSGQYPVVAGISKLETEPPIWFMDIDDERVELTTADLQNYRMFQQVCMEQLTIMFLPMKAETWAQMVSEAMQSAVIIEAAPETSISGHFLEILETFVMDRHRGETKEDLILGKPWLNPEDGRHYFRLQDLMRILERENFKAWGRNKVGSYIEEIGGKHGWNIRGKFISTFWVDDNFSTTPTVPLPKTKESPV